MFLGEALFEGGHGLSTLADLIENFAIRACVHAFGVGETCGRRVIRSGIRTVAFPGLAVAVGAFIEINGAGSGENGRRGLDRILAKPSGFGNFPRAVLIDGDGDGNDDDGEQCGEKEFAEAERASRVGVRRQSEIFAYRLERLKKEMIFFDLQRTGGSEKKDGWQNGAVIYRPRKMSQRSSALKKRMAAATIQAMAAVRRELANSPILARSPVN